MPSRPRRWSASYSLRSGCQEQTTCILDSLSLSDSPTPMDVSVDSAYYTSSPGSSTTSSPTHTNDICSMRTRSSTWGSSFRSILRKIPPSPTKASTTASPLIVQSEPVSIAGPSDATSLPTTEAELDTFLADVWKKDVTDHPRTTTSPVSQYIRRVTELKGFYDQKMAEISQREATYVSELTYFDDTTPLISASQIGNLDGTSLRQMVMESKLGFKFDDLRFKVKQEVAQTILGLRSQYIAYSGPKKSRKLKPKATKMLTEWFENHIDHPYPTEAEKQLLASQSGVTTEQVTTWFCNKRSRSKKMRELYGRRDKRRTL